MHDTAPTNQPRSNAREETAAAISRLSSAHVHKEASAPVMPERRGLLMRLAGFIARLFTGWRKKPVVIVAAPEVAERAATAIAAGAEPPMVFRGDTANTLVTPMGAYAGKPLEQAMRKRAEQQFKNMDITTATMN